jgi:hypothetical protein
MLTLERISTLLADRRISRVSRATGLHYNTIRNIRDGKCNNPTLRIQSALSDYLTETTETKTEQ